MTSVPAVTNAGPTTRTMLEAAATHVAARDGRGYRPAKAAVHAMALVDLVAIPEVRRMLYEAAIANLVDW